MHRSRALRGSSCALALCSLLSCGGSDGTGVDTEAVATVTVSPPSSSIDIGQTVQLGAVARNSDGEPVGVPISWSSSPLGVVTVSNSGLVTAVAEGATTITALAEGRSGTASVGVADPFPPGSPSGIQTTTVSDTRIDVAWVDNSNNEDEFVIEREPLGAAAPGQSSGAAVFVEVGSVGADATTYQDTDVESGMSYRYRVAACNANGCSDASDNSANTVTFLTLVIQTSLLPDGVTGLSYDATLVAMGGTGDAVWSVTEGSLPDGLTLAPLTGAVSGDPTTAGTFDFTVQAEGAGQTVTRELSIFVSDVPFPPVVTTVDLPVAAVGASYGATLEATQGDGTFTWAVSGGSFPDGLDLDAASGAITGIPTADGTFDFTVDVTSAEMTEDAALSITVLPTLEVSTTDLPTGVEGQAYDASLSADGGDGTDTWSLESGSLPEGLVLTPDGSISGTLEAAAPMPPAPGLAAVVGTSDFTVKVENSLGQSATRALSITVYAVLEVTTTQLPDGQVDVGYSQVVVATGGDGAYTWSLAGGGLPPGLALNANTGEISGSPQNSGTFDFTVEANSGDGQTAQEALAITVEPAPVVITTTALPDGEAGTPYNQTIVASGGTGTYTWAVTTGALPDGLLLDENSGAISGTPTATGMFDFTVEVSSGGQMDDQDLSITIVAAPLSLDNYILAGAYPGVIYSDFFLASGGDGTYTFAHTAGILPDGLALNTATGELSGTAGTPGAYYFTIEVTSDGSSVSRTYALAISTQAAAGFNLAIANGAGLGIPSAAVIAALSVALSTWESVIVADLGDHTYGPADIPPGYCSADGLNGRTVDDIIVMVRLSVIDGPGSILGSAGPCDARVYFPINFATLFGRLTLDTSDLAALDAHQLASLFFHEIAHVVGIGTIWPLFSQAGGTDLISDAIANGGTDPKYKGAGGNAVYTGSLGGGSSGMETEIPIEATGGPGTEDSHWAEWEFDNEIMTGWAESSGIMMPISEMTIAAVGDFFYTVSTAVAEPFTVPGCAPACVPAPPPPGGFGAPAIGDRLLDDIHDEDLRGVLPDGTIVVFPRP